MVYAFHDCSPQGLELVNRLRTSPTWFQEHQVTIIDLGLLPRQVLATPKHLFIQRTTRSAAEAKRMTADVRQTLTATELD
jgi:hypothetical protein